MFFDQRAKRRQQMKRVAVGSAIAATAGYVAGVLTAPKSGKETRADIKNTAAKGVKKAERELKKLHTDLDKSIKEGAEKAKQAGSKAQKELLDLLAKAKEAKDKTRVVLSAIHEGEAEDKDLNKAIKQANTALKNLRTYLKK